MEEMGELLDKVNKLHKAKESELNQSRRLIGEKENALSAWMKKHKELESKYMELDKKWDNLTKLMGKVVGGK